jgi:putative ABC transport system permease protein
VGIALTIIFIGFAIGMEQQSVKIAVKTRTGHIKIHDKGYIDDELTLTLDYTIENYQELLNSILDFPGVETAAERVIFPASITDGLDELQLAGVGIHTERENEAFELSSRLIQGEYIKPGEEKVLLTNEIAKLFKVKTGDIMTIISRTKYDAINALDLEIAGIVHVGNPEVDNMNFFIPLDVAQEFLEMQNEVTEISVFGSTMEGAEGLAQNIRKDFDGNRYDIVTWEYIARDIIRLYEFRSRARQIIIFIILLMASASVMNTMLMSIFERTREIGTLLAFGMRRAKILQLFTIEGTFLGVFGSFVGCLLGGSLTYYYKFNGIDVSQYSGGSGFGNMPISSIIYAEITPFYIIGSFLLGVIVAMLSAAYPAMKGSRLQPTDALRSV